ncbi:MAG: hypothetical protein MZU97_11750 [Bacillus subtilis]|nr:hypothetical protein [Bacillus subtilis]
MSYETQTAFPMTTLNRAIKYPGHHRSSVLGVLFMATQFRGPLDRGSPMPIQAVIVPGGRSPI